MKEVIIKSCEINTNKVEKMLCVSNSYIILKYKNKKSLYKVKFSKEKIEIKGKLLSSIGYISDSTGIENCNYFVIAYKENRHIPGESPIYRLEVIDAMNMDGFGTYLYTMGTPIVKLLYSNCDGILFSFHSKGDISMWEIVIDEKDLL